MKNNRTHDFDVRVAVVRALLGLGLPRDAIRHEITLDTSSSDGRADIVLALDHGLVVGEIKSDMDKLDLLERQGARYKRRFDRLAVFHGSRHRDAIEKMPFGPARWWDAAHEAEVVDGAVRLKPAPWSPLAALIEPPGRHPSTSLSSFAMLELLHKREIDTVAAKLRFGGPFPRYRAIQLLGDQAAIAEMRPLIAQALRQRAPNRWEAAFWPRFDALHPAAGAIEPAQAGAAGAGDAGQAA